MTEGPSQSVEDHEAALFAVVAQRMKAARLRAGVSVAELATRIGVKKPYIFELERGTGNPTLRTLNKVACALGVDASDFFPQSSHPVLSELHVNSLIAVCDTLAAMLTGRRDQEEEARQREVDAVDALRTALRRLTPLQPGDPVEPDKDAPEMKRDRPRAKQTPLPR